MDSLLASYASSDEEEHETQPSAANFSAKAEDEKHDDFLPKSTAKRGGIFNSLPLPKSSLFNSLPPPKLESLANPMPQAESEHQRDGGGRAEQIVENSKPKSSSSLFSSLPQPKSSSASASSSASKRVVQFKPPSMVNLRSSGVDDEDDSEDEGEKEKQRKKLKESLSTASPSSFLSSIPAPRHSATLGAMPSALGSGRRSIVETDNPASSLNTVGTAGSDANANFNVGHSSDQPNEMNYDYSTWGSGNASHAHYPDAGVNSNAEHSGDQSHNYDQSSSLGGENYAYYSGYGVGSADVNSVGSDPNAASYEAGDYSYGNGHVEYANYGGSYGDYGNGAHHGYNYTNATALPEVSGDVGNALRLPGKRGRKDNPPEIIEVKQDELIKNRPREDQVKSTGIAFGPAYQPASTKGKPTKLHKRKHQIGSLYFDMRQKETELAERRSKGFLTKAQTQAKYGW